MGLFGLSVITTSGILLRQQSSQKLSFVWFAIQHRSTSSSCHAITKRSVPHVPENCLRSLSAGVSCAGIPFSNMFSDTPKTCPLTCSVSVRPLKQQPGGKSKEHTGAFGVPKCFGTPLPPILPHVGQIHL